MRPRILPALLIAAVSSGTDTPPLTPGALVSALDEQIQLRFLDTGFGFGMSRVCGPVGHSPLGGGIRRFPQPPDFVWRNPVCGGRDWAPFRPVNSQEAWVVSEVVRAGAEIWTVLIAAKQRSLEGPVVVGTESPDNLAAIRRQLLARAAEPSISQDPLDVWQVTVKPVRASREACLNCHNNAAGDRSTPRVRGDPLGFIVYLFRGKGSGTDARNDSLALDVSGRPPHH